MAEPGTKPFIIPVFLPHGGCPHQCVFCNQQTITGAAAVIPSPRRVREIIDRHLAYPRRKARAVEVAFYGGNFLGLDKGEALGLLEAATPYVDAGKVGSIRFSTRPDTITPARLDAVAPFPVGTVEIGAQSMNDAVLAGVRRGHSAGHTRQAVAHLRDRGFGVGLQMMVGLPGQSIDDALETGRQIAALKPDLVRIYPTLVLRGSPLARRYARGEYQPLTLSESVDAVAALLTEFQVRGIAVGRMGLQGSAALEKEGEILSGPYHPAFGHLVHARRFLALATRALEGTGCRGQGAACLTVHPRNLSRLRGQNNENVRRLRERFGLTRLVIRTDAGLPEGRIRTSTPEGRKGESDLPAPCRGKGRLANPTDGYGS